MNTEALFLFLILLLGLLLCSFLGGNCGYEGFTGNVSGTLKNSQPNSNTTSNANGTSTTGASTNSSVNYDNYNHYSGNSTELVNGTTFYGENGGSVIVNIGSNGSQELKIILKRGDSPIIFKTTPPATTPATTTPSSSATKQEGYTNRYTNYSDNNVIATKFYGPNGETANIVRISNGLKINVLTSSGYYTYFQSGTQENSNTMSSTQYYGSTGSPIQTSATTLAYQDPYDESSSVKRRHSDNKKYHDNASASTNSSIEFLGSTNYNDKNYNDKNYNDQYYSTLPKGIPASQIPMGQEDLYILKSQIVPPVCPACPSVNISSQSSSTDETKCPACPPCGRCPESNFECKKIPNYSAIDNQYLPMPVLNDFSTFGM